MGPICAPNCGTGLDRYQCDASVSDDVTTENLTYITKPFDSTCDPLIIGECKINCLLYADDLTLLSESENGLQRCLDKLSCYVKKWQMRINMKKTKAIIFKISGKIFRNEFKLSNQPIQITDNYVHLGITFTTSGSFSLA